MYRISKKYPVPGKHLWSRKSFFQALDSVDLTLPEKQISTILGPNGAGKTTLLKIISGLILPDGGNLAWKNGAPRIGFVTPNERSFYWRLSGRDNLSFFASLNGLDKSRKKGKIEAALEEVGLGPDGDKPYRQYSAGMKQKLNIARAILAEPDLFLLDEPTSHLDPLAKADFWDFIEKSLLRERNATLLLCTHDMEEAARLSDRILLLNEGRVLAQGTESELQDRIRDKGSYELAYAPADAPLEWLEKICPLSPRGKGKVLMNCREESLSPIIRELTDRQIRIISLARQQPDLLHIMKHYIKDSSHAS